MTLQDQLAADLKHALRDRDEPRKSALRMALAALKYARVEANRDLTHDEMVGALGKEIKIPSIEKWRRLVGLRLFASKPGKIKTIDTSIIEKDPRVVEISIRAGRGKEIELPPHDYASWLLGHIIFMPTDPHHIEKECQDIAGKLFVEMEALPWALAKC